MRFVIALDAALVLLRQRTMVSPANSLVAPTLLRSQILSALFAEVSRGELDRNEAEARLDHMRALKIRLLGDRVLQKAAWNIAAELGWKDTFTAEYIALTNLQADALVTLDESLARLVRGRVSLATIDDIVG